MSLVKIVSTDWEINLRWPWRIRNHRRTRPSTNLRPVKDRRESQAPERVSETSPARLREGIPTCKPFSPRPLPPSQPPPPSHPPPLRFRSWRGNLRSGKRQHGAPKRRESTTTLHLLKRKRNERFREGKK